MQLLETRMSSRSTTSGGIYKFDHFHCVFCAYFTRKTARKWEARRGMTSGGKWFLCNNSDKKHLRRWWTSKLSCGANTHFPKRRKDLRRHVLSRLLWDSLFRNVNYKHLRLEFISRLTRVTWRGVSTIAQRHSQPLLYIVRFERRAYL